MATLALDATYTVDPQPSGIAVYSRKLIEALARLETRHRFLVCYRLSRLGRWREFLRPGPPESSSGPGFSLCLFQEPLTFWLPWRAHLFHSLAQRPAPFRFTKEIVTIHDIFPLSGRDYSTPEFQRKFSRLLLEAVARAALVITPSEYTAEQLVRHAGLVREKIRVIPEGVDLPDHWMTPEERVLERERLVGKGNELVLSVGALQTRKNIVNSLRALELLPPRYRMILAGGDGHGSEAIHDFIRNGQLGSRVAVLGHVSAGRLDAMYQSAGVLLFPSLEEGFGLPVLEAMSHGLPVVASNASSLPEVGGDAVLYADPHDVREIADNVLRAVEDASLREQLIEKGVARARDFSWRRTAEATLRVYEEALSM